MKSINLFIALFFFLSTTFNSLADYELLHDTDVLSIKTVVSKQLQAFSNDNAMEAFSYASPKIKSIFGNPNNFIAMVKESYPSVYRPKNINIGTVEMLKGIPTLLVYLVGPDGNFVTANYLMQKQPDKQWKIDGCIVTKANSKNI